MKKIIIYIFFCVNIFTNAQNNLEQKEIDFLDKLIADGSKIPTTKGQLYKHNPKIKFKNVNDFDKKLTNYQINFDKKITIIVFWERKDKYSKLILPKLENIKKKHKNIQIYTINTNDFDDKNALITFFNDYHSTENIFDATNNKYYEKKSNKYFKPLTIPVLFADKKLKQNYGVTAFPATIIANKQGEVYTAMIGVFEEYEEWIDDVINGITKPK